MKEVTSSVEALEIEAERILEKAKAKANEILLASEKEVEKILSSKLPLGKVKIECDNIVDKAKVEAEGKIGDSEKKASEINTGTDEKMEEIVAHIVAIVVGRS